MLTVCVVAVGGGTGCMTVADPYDSFFNHQTKAEVLSLLESGWGEGNITDLQLTFLYGPENDQ